MSKYIFCYDEETANKLKDHFNLIIESNGFYYFENDTSKATKVLSEFSENDFEFVDKLIIDV